jgi:hypothetical protein
VRACGEKLVRRARGGSRPHSRSDEYGSPARFAGADAVIGIEMTCGSPNRPPICQVPEGIVGVSRRRVGGAARVRKTRAAPDETKTSPRDQELEAVGDSPRSGAAVDFGPAGYTIGESFGERKVHRRGAAAKRLGG